MSTQILQTTHEDLDTAADLLRAGRLVAFPTETVYGLGADATNGTAVAGIFAAKQRPSFNPLIVHVQDVENAKTFVEWSTTAQILADAFWPGPMTLVLPLASNAPLSELVTAGLPSVAVRVPANPVAQSLLRKCNRPIAAPSANPSGQISPTSADHVRAGLSGTIAAIVDAGPCSVGLESTIVGLTGNPQLLRPGGLAAEEIEAVLGAPLGKAGDAITAPGQMTSHYAPNATVRLNAITAQTGEVHLGFGDIAGDLSLSKSGDLIEAAANLFGCLHRLNASGQPIAVAPIPHTGLGAAINDRLMRAAAPRD